MEAIEKNQEYGSANTVRLIEGNTAFAFALYQELKHEQGNLFFSPHSLSTALAMTYAGARGNTASQMRKALCFRLDPEQLHPAFAQLDEKIKAINKKGQIQLKAANALWPQQGYGFMETFLALAEAYYGVQIRAVNYLDSEAARREINAWVEEKTEQMIQELIPPGVFDHLTRLVLVNAIYFKGSWADQFDPSRTAEATFYLPQAEQVGAPLMTMKGELRYAQEDDLQILELPYAGGDLSMLVLLPSQVNGLGKLEASLTLENLNRWSRVLWAHEVQVFLPKFKIEFPMKLNETLKAMGMQDAFESTADFSGLDGSKLLFIKAVLHKAFVEVNEEGTEAAAATAVVVKARSMGPPPAVFRADHPFVFLIRENLTGNILFLGRLVNPTA